MKKALVVVGVVVLLAAAFWGGTYYTTSTTSGTGAAVGSPPNGAGGPMGGLTASEQAELENMTDAERQAFMQQKMGSMDTSGTPGGGMGGRAGGGMTVEGEVIEIADDTITIKTTNGSSSTVYTDDETVIGYAEGAAQIAAGSNVIAISTPEADGVNTATGILVR